MAAPRLSVVMPNRNHQVYIREALDAILGQSVPAGEVIVIDDASTDSSVKVVEEYARRAPSVVLLKNEKNLGVAASTMRGLERATGEYVMFTASDDTVLPGYFEKALTLFAANPRAGAAFAQCRVIDAKGAPRELYLTPAAVKTPRFVAPEEALPLTARLGAW